MELISPLLASTWSDPSFWTTNGPTYIHLTNFHYVDLRFLCLKEFVLSAIMKSCKHHAFVLSSQSDVVTLRVAWKGSSIIDRLNGSVTDTDYVYLEGLNVWNSKWFESFHNSCKNIWESHCKMVPLTHATNTIQLDGEVLEYIWALVNGHHCKH